MKKTIILVDDDKAIHFHTKIILEKAGYNFVSAFSANEGFGKIKGQCPDLIILDYLMPEKNGVELFKQLVADISDFNTPVIMLTALGNGDAKIREILKEGITLYLEKPFGQKELLNLIQNIFINNDLSIENIELKRAIENTKNFLENLVQSCPALIITADKNGFISYANKAITTILGFSPTEIIGTHLNDFLEVGRDLNLFSLEGLGNGFVNREFEIKSKLTGQYLTLGVTLSYLKNFDDRVEGLLALGQDISIRKQLEKELMEKERLRGITESMATINHQINNPLTPILGNLQLMRKDDKHFQDEDKKKLEIIEINAKKICDIVKSFNEISKPITQKYYGEINMLKL